MTELEGAVLIRLGACDEYSKINLIHPEVCCSQRYVF
jgi:hypothetical protein